MKRFGSYISYLVMIFCLQSFPSLLAVGQETSGRQIFLTNGPDQRTSFRVEVLKMQCEDWKEKYKKINENGTKITSALKDKGKELKDAIDKKDDNAAAKIQKEIDTLKDDEIKNNKEREDHEKRCPYPPDTLEARMGRIFMQGLSGGKMLGDENVDGVLEGIKLGILSNSANACGEVLHDKIKGTINHVGGGFWDYCLGWVIDLWSDIGSVLFHGGHDPFERGDLQHWGMLVQGCFKNVEKVTKNGLKDSSRGRDMTFRPTGDITEDEEVEESKSSITAWKLLIRGYADQLDHVVTNIDTRIKYYEENSEEVFYATQIKTRLLEFRDMLLASKSIKDFDDFIESNKSFIPALRDNVLSLFDHLARKVTPRTYSLEKSSAKSTEKSWLSKDDDEDDDAFGSFRRF